jgi:hypothetical protein
MAKPAANMATVAIAATANRNPHDAQAKQARKAV